MKHKITGEILEDPPPGIIWGLTKVLGKIICWALKRRSFYNIVSECLEKGGKQIMNIENLEEKIETITKNSTELKEGNRSFEAKLNAITKNSTELKEGNRSFEAKLNAIAENHTELKEDNRELREGNRELREGNRELREKLTKDSREFKKMMKQILENQKK